MEYDPVAPGTDNVSATIPGFITLPTATQTITVTGAAINLSGVGNVGSGLVTGTSGSLGGGAIVRVDLNRESRFAVDQLHQERED